MSSVVVLKGRESAADVRYGCPLCKVVYRSGANLLAHQSVAKCTAFMSNAEELEALRSSLLAGVLQTQEVGAEGAVPVTPQLIPAPSAARPVPAAEVTPVPLAVEASPVGEMSPVVVPAPEMLTPVPEVPVAVPVVADVPVQAEVPVQEISSAAVPAVPTAQAVSERSVPVVNGVSDVAAVPAAVPVPVVAPAPTVVPAVVPVPTVAPAAPIAQPAEPDEVSPVVVAPSRPVVPDVVPAAVPVPVVAPVPDAVPTVVPVPAAPIAQPAEPNEVSPVVAAPSRPVVPDVVPAVVPVAAAPIAPSTAPLHPPHIYLEVRISSELQAALEAKYSDPRLFKVITSVGDIPSDLPAAQCLYVVTMEEGSGSRCGGCVLSQMQSLMQVRRDCGGLQFARYETCFLEAGQLHSLRAHYSATSKTRIPSLPKPTTLTYTFADDYDGRIVHIDDYYFYRSAEAAGTTVQIEVSFEDAPQPKTTSLDLRDFKSPQALPKASAFLKKTGDKTIWRVNPKDWMSVDTPAKRYFKMHGLTPVPIRIAADGQETDAPVNLTEVSALSVALGESDASHRPVFLKCVDTLCGL